MINLEDVTWEPSSGKTLEFVAPYSDILHKKNLEWAAYNEEIRKDVEKNRNAVSLFLAFAHYLKNKDIWPTT